VAGGVTRRAAQSEIGWHEIQLTGAGVRDPVIGGLPERFEAFEWHHDHFLLPARAVPLARSSMCLQAFRLEDRPAWGVQFHPEVTLAILEAWLDGWEEDEDAVASGLDPEAIRLESRGKIVAQIELGRGIASRFLAEAASA
jgi:GMP synthase (glutamine-hydrolysing)